jgi:hypothetical protein
VQYRSSVPDGEVLSVVRAAIADVDELCAHSLDLLEESSHLLELMAKLACPRIGETFGR